MARRRRRSAAQIRRDRIKAAVMMGANPFLVVLAIVLAVPVAVVAFGILLATAFSIVSGVVLLVTGLAGP